MYKLLKSIFGGMSAVSNMYPSQAAQDNTEAAARKVLVVMVICTPPFFIYCRKIRCRYYRLSEYSLFYSRNIQFPLICLVPHFRKEFR